MTTSTRAGLKNGYFRNVLLVDTVGRAIRIRDARKLHGVGFLWGYNLFLNQRIKVELDVVGEPITVSLSDVKQMVRDSFRRWHGWSARGDFEELRASIANAGSILEIIELVSD